MSSTTLSNATASQAPINKTRWNEPCPCTACRGQPGIYFSAGMTVLAFALTAYRELAGLGPVSGMNDAYGWASGRRST